VPEGQHSDCGGYTEAARDYVEAKGSTWVMQKVRERAQGVPEKCRG